MLMTGILGLPYAFRKGGIVGGCLTTLISAVTINYCIKKLIKVAALCPSAIMPVLQRFVDHW
jgi:amino acid permease